MNFMRDSNIEGALHISLDRLVFKILLIDPSANFLDGNTRPWPFIGGDLRIVWFVDAEAALSFVGGVLRGAASTKNAIGISMNLEPFDRSPLFGKCHRVLCLRVDFDSLEYKHARADFDVFDGEDDCTIADFRLAQVSKEDLVYFTSSYNHDGGILFKEGSVIECQGILR